MHGSPSLHDAPVGAFTQAPAAQLSAVQGSLSLQFFDVPTQVPVAHVSPTVQPSPSSQAELVAVFVQLPPAAHASIVHGF